MIKLLVGVGVLFSGMMAQAVPAFDFKCNSRDSQAFEITGTLSSANELSKISISKYVGAQLTLIETLPQTLTGFETFWDGFQIRAFVLPVTSKEFAAVNVTLAFPPDFQKMENAGYPTQWFGAGLVQFGKEAGGMARLDVNLSCTHN